MNKNISFCILLVLLIPDITFGHLPSFAGSVSSSQNPVIENQILYNGREWHNQYTQVRGDQFLFTKDYLPATITINGMTYKNVNINYDIYNDELITVGNHGITLQLNKEMVDSFSIFYIRKTYNFLNLHDNDPSGIRGYVNALHQGKSLLVVKYKKEIDLLAVDDKYDLFFQTYKIYLMKDGNSHQISGKKDLLNALEDKKTLIKEFMKKNMIKVSKKDPDSFIPVIRYYDSLSQ
jgi:hypothetical protein